MSFVDVKNIASIKRSTPTLPAVSTSISASFQIRINHVTMLGACLRGLQILKHTHIGWNL